MRHTRGALCICTRHVWRATLNREIRRGNVSIYVGNDYATKKIDIFFLAMEKGGGTSTI